AGPPGHRTRIATANYGKVRCAARRRAAWRARVRHRSAAARARVAGDGGERAGLVARAGDAAVVAAGDEGNPHGRLERDEDARRPENPRGAPEPDWHAADAGLARVRGANGRTVSNGGGRSPGRDCRDGRQCNPLHSGPAGKHTHGAAAAHTISSAIDDGAGDRSTRTGAIDCATRRGSSRDHAVGGAGDLTGDSTPRSRPWRPGRGCGLAAVEGSRRAARRAAPRRGRTSAVQGVYRVRQGAGPERRRRRRARARRGETRGRAASHGRTVRNDRCGQHGAGPRRRAGGNGGKGHGVPHHGEYAQHDGRRLVVLHHKFRGGTPDGDGEQRHGQSVAQPGHAGRNLP
ncbi:unnamed protein product, partial [Amoebophrya sp. A120]